MGDTSIGADAEMINSLPGLEIVATYSVGLDKIDLEMCRQKGIRVTNTPDVLTDDVADLAIGLAIAVLRRVCVADGFVRAGNWKGSDFGLATKVFSSGLFLFCCLFAQFCCFLMLCCDLCCLLCIVTQKYVSLGILKLLRDVVIDSEWSMDDNSDAF